MNMTTQFMCTYVYVCIVLGKIEKNILIVPDW